jgi:hypothetical protein
MMNNKMKLFGIGLVVVLAVTALGVGIAFAQTLTHNNGSGLGWTMNSNTQKVNGYSMMGNNTQNGNGYDMMSGNRQTNNGSGMMSGNGQTGYGSGMMSDDDQNGSGWEWMDGMHEWMTSSGGMHTFVWNALAEKLDLTSDELYAEVNSGKTIAQIAEEKGVGRADLIAALETAHQENLAQAVTDSALTQEQADNVLAQMAGRYEWMLDNMGSGGMMSGQYGTGGCHGNWSDSTTNPQPKP